MCATPPTAPTGRRVDVRCGCNFSFNLIHSRFKVIHLCANMPLSRTLVSRCWAPLSGVKGANEWAAPGKLPLCTIHVCVYVCCPNLSKSAGVNSPHTPTLGTHTLGTHTHSLCALVSFVHLQIRVLRHTQCTPNVCAQPRIAHLLTRTHTHSHAHTHMCACLMSTPHLRQRRGANLRLKGFWRTSLACNADSDASFFSSLSCLPLSLYISSASCAQRSTRARRQGACFSFPANCAVVVRPQKSLNSQLDKQLNS